MRTFLEGETYYVEHPTYGWGLIRPSHTQTDENHLIGGTSLGNMNGDHWPPHQTITGKPVYVRGDGTNTHPWEKGVSLSVGQRKTRLATAEEKALLDRAIEIDGALTDAEIREIRINLLLEQ